MSPRYHPLCVLALFCVSCAGDSGATADTDANDTDPGGTDADDDACVSGAEGCLCGPDNICDPGLVCLSEACVSLQGPAECGNGNLDPGEECDLGQFNADEGACKTDCTLQTCGDGVVGPGEACDDGNAASDDDCTAGCEFATCGDGIVQPPEECDDGNDVDDDDCRNVCLLPACGDGVVQAGEACDGGNDEKADGCEPDCSLTVPATCGNGSFDADELCFDQVQLLAGMSPRRPVLVDLDDDGDDDLLVPNADSDDVWIWTSNGDGSFEEPAVVSAPGGPVSVAVLDFDGDGELDLVTANRAGDEAQIHFGTGPLAFAPPTPVDLPAAGPTAVLAVNFAADANADFIVAQDIPDARGTFVSFFYGGGSQTPPFLGSDVELPAGLRPQDLILADPGATGMPHIIAVDTQASKIRSLRFIDADNIQLPGSGAFDLPLGSQPHGLAVGDLNGDGADDVVTANWNPDGCNYVVDPDACPWNTVTILFGNPNGEPLFVGKQDYPVGKAPWSPVVVDANGDGHLDILVANGHSSTVSMLAGDSTGAFDPQIAFVYGPSAGAVHVATAQLDDDGFPDLVLSRTEGNTLLVLTSSP